MNRWYFHLFRVAKERADRQNRTEVHQVSYLLLHVLRILCPYLA
nr:hypothetical protein [Listeria rocourtiae]